MYLSHFRIFLVILCVVSVFRARAQDGIAYQQFTSENGLSENVVYCLHRDRQGFIWAGTDYGLNRFDGYSFLKFFHDPADTNTLSNHSVLSINEDAAGNFWLLTYSGVDYFQPGTGKTKRLRIPGYATDFAPQSLRLTSGGMLLLLLDNFSSALYDPVKASWRFMKLPPGHSFYNFSGFVLPDKRAGIFARQVAGKRPLPMILDEGAAKWIPATGASIWPGIKSDSPFFQVLFAGGDQLLISQSAPQFQLLDSTGKLLFSFHPGNDPRYHDLLVFDAVKRGEGVYWVATNRGILAYERGGAALYPVLLQGDSRSLPGNKEIRCLLNDGHGSTWIGLFGEGLLRVNNRQTVFRHIALPELTGERFLRMIFGLYPWPNGMVVAETGFQNFIFIKEGRVVKRANIRELGADEIVFATTGRKLHQTSPFQRALLQRWHRENKLIPFRFRLQGDSGVIRQFYDFTAYFPSGTRTTTMKLVGNCMEDDQYYWAAAYNGLYRIRKSDFSETVYRYDPRTPVSLSASSLYHLEEDENGIFWIGTKGGGLNGFDRRRNRFFHYTTADGLADNVVYFVKSDRKGHLWLTTNKGITRFDIRTRRFSNFSKRDGLLNMEFNRQGGVRLPDGTLYLSGTSGIDFFHPDSIPEPVAPGGVNFSGLNVNGQDTDLGRTATFRHKENNIRFTFTAGDYSRPDLIYYRYRLGADEPWTRVQGMNTAVYSALPPGQYRFEVQASYDNDLWSPPTLFAFTIRRPWWNRTWFYVSVALLLLGGLYLFYRYRISQLKKLHRLRSRISQDLHDEVGATLTSISFLSEVARKQSEGSPDAPVIQTLDKIGEYSREMIGEINDIVWAINPANDRFDRLADRMRNFALPLLTARNIRFKFVAGEELAAFSLGMALRKNLYLVFKEAVNNAAKYASCSEVSVQLALDRDRLTLRVIDNGTGFDTGTVREGNGLENMRHRAEEIDAMYRLESEPGKGTRVILEVPLTQNADAGG